MTTESTTETPMETARRHLPWGTTVYTITRRAYGGRHFISPLIVTEDSSILDLTDTLEAIGFERTPGSPGIRVDGRPAEVHEELVTRISEAVLDDPAELMHEQL